MTEAEHKSWFEPTKYTTYLTLMGKLWDAFCKNLGDNWRLYNSTTLYIQYLGLYDELLHVCWVYFEGKI